MRSNLYLLGSLLMMFSAVSNGQIQSKELHYQSADGTSLVAHYSYDDSWETPRPGVLVVHEWWGLNDYAKTRARQLAELGYSALAIDMYGDGRTTTHPNDAKAFMQEALRDPTITRQRFTSALELLQAQEHTQSNKIAAIGYCFGGKVVLDMARQGLPLAAVASFHGALVPAIAATPGSVKGKILVAHGAQDSMISAEQVQAFKTEMDAAGADYQFLSFAGAKHGFSNPASDAAQAQGLDLAYNKEADEQSWAALLQLLSQTFAP